MSQHKRTKIKVVVELTVMSNKRLTKDDREQVVADMDYSFDFTEILNGNFIHIVDTEITDTLESD